MFTYFQLTILLMLTLRTVKMLAVSSWMFVDALSANVALCALSSVFAPSPPKTQTP